jgi:hypothetical protein
MKYTVRPTGHLDLVERGLATMYRESKGEREVVGDYQNALLPNGSSSFRVFFDSSKRRYDINIPTDELNKIAEELRLPDSDKKETITMADITNEYDPFMSHPDLTVAISNGGQTFDTDTAWGKFWWHAFNSDTKRFNIDNGTDNPLVKKVQEFKVTTAGHDEKEVSKAIKEGIRATDVFHSLKGNYKQMMNVVRAFDIHVSDNPDIEMLRTAIYVKITTEKDFKTRDGMRNIEKFLAITDMKQDDLETRAKITEAIGFGIITKDGRKLLFNDEVLGINAEQAFQYLSRTENLETKSKLLAKMIEKGKK